VLALLALPGAAHACAVCGAAVDRSKSAFLGTTILLSLLPLAMIGAGLWWIARQAGAKTAGDLAVSGIQGVAPGSPVDEGEA